MIDNKRVRGVEPPYLDWQSSALAVVLHPHLCQGPESNRIFIFFRDTCAPATLPWHGPSGI